MATLTRRPSVLFTPAPAEHRRSDRSPVKTMVPEALQQLVKLMTENDNGEPFTVNNVFTNPLLRDDSVFDELAEKEATLQQRRQQCHALTAIAMCVPHTHVLLVTEDAALGVHDAGLTSDCERKLKMSSFHFRTPSVGSPMIPSHTHTRSYSSGGPSYLPIPQETNAYPRCVPTVAALLPEGPRKFQFQILSTTSAEELCLFFQQVESIVQTGSTQQTTPTPAPGHTRNLSATSDADAPGRYTPPQEIFVAAEPIGQHTHTFGVRTTRLPSYYTAIVLVFDVHNANEHCASALLNLMRERQVASTMFPVNQPPGSDFHPLVTPITIVALTEDTRFSNIPVALRESFALSMALPLGSLLLAPPPQNPVVPFHLINRIMFELLAQSNRSGGVTLSAGAATKSTAAAATTVSGNSLVTAPPLHGRPSWGRIGCWGAHPGSAFGLPVRQGFNGTVIPDLSWDDDSEHVVGTTAGPESLFLPHATNLDVMDQSGAVICHASIDRYVRQHLALLRTQLCGPLATGSAHAGPSRHLQTIAILRATALLFSPHIPLVEPLLNLSPADSPPKIGIILGRGSFVVNNSKRDSIRADTNLDGSEYAKATVPPAFPPRSSGRVLVNADIALCLIPHLAVHHCCMTSKQVESASGNAVFRQDHFQQLRPGRKVGELPMTPINSKRTPQVSWTEATSSSPPEPEKLHPLKVDGLWDSCSSVDSLCRLRRRLGLDHLLTAHFRQKNSDLSFEKSVTGEKADRLPNAGGLPTITVSDEALSIETPTSALPLPAWITSGNGRGASYAAIMQLTYSLLIEQQAINPPPV